MALEMIENATVKELKEQYDAMAELAMAAPQHDVVRRYLQARLDAKLRDDRLAQQGVMLETNKQGLQAAIARAELMQGQYEALAAQYATQQQHLSDCQAHMQELQAALTKAARTMRLLKGYVHQQQQALSAVGKLAQDTVASMQVELLTAAEG